ncbi:adhesin, partial [Staphylococcus aureus]|nr:adhesin [Staphylococcus aureus]
EAENITNEARTSHDEATAKIKQLLEQATVHQQASSDNVTKRTQEADAIRQSALEEAETTRNQAARDAENRIATAHRQAAMMK